MTSPFNNPLRLNSRATLVVLLMVLPLTISLMAGAYQNHPDYRSGAPGEGTCRDCHSSYGLNTGGANIMVMGIPEMYHPGKAYTLIAVSEGAKPIGGDVVVDRMVHESPDPVRLGGVSEVLCEQIAERTHLECRATILGHVQRGGTPTARDRVLATQFGHRAVEMVTHGEFNRMVAMQCGRLTSVPIAEVADRERLVPLDDPLLIACRATGVSFGD